MDTHRYYDVTLTFDRINPHDKQEETNCIRTGFVWAESEEAAIKIVTDTLQEAEKDNSPKNIVGVAKVSDRQDTSK